MARNDITTKSNPVIELSPLSIPDGEFGTSGTDRSGEKASEKAGSYMPYISINGMVFSESLLKSFILDVTEFLPTVTFVIEDVAENFINDFYPMDGDVVSVYIKSENKDFKPIRQDYRISNANSLPSDGNKTKFIVSASLDIPKLYADYIKSYPESTSLKVAEEISEHLSLGFASNEDETNDSMNWICPNVTILDFIKNDLLCHSYKDDNSFFICFIDQYYYLNFLEVNTLIKKEFDFEKVSNVLIKESYYEDSVNENTTEYFFLTNASSASPTPNYITKYTVLNNSGDISMSTGYRNIINSYSKNDKEMEQYFLESLSTDGTTEDEIILRGKASENSEDHPKSFWFGGKSKENIHENYYFADANNKINNDELGKINLKVYLPSINTSIHKYKIVPVHIVNKNDAFVDAQPSADTDQETNISVNKLLSGFYIVTSIKYAYLPKVNEFRTELILSKREFNKSITRS